MKEQDELASVPNSATATVQLRPSVWQRLKAFGLRRLFLACLGIGAGIGVGAVTVAFCVAWLTSRPIPLRDWPSLEIESAGLKAKLKTDWNESVRYQLVVRPRSDDLKASFDDKVRTHRDSISFTNALV
jgi:hypothetical protein